MISLNNNEFHKIVDYAKSNFGLNLIEKKTLIESRLQKVLDENNIKSFPEYYNYLITDTTNNAVVSFINKITTNHTFFMREAEHFKFYKETVLPYLLEFYRKEKDLRIWSAGCSTGEEAYTLAMINHDALINEKLLWDGKILATDISREVIDKAQKGQYSALQVQDIPLNWRMKYFTKNNNDAYAIKNEIKNDVIFRWFNLMEEFHFKKKFQVIFCRNVMIYFDEKTKINLVRKLYEYTEPGGYLFIGHSESLNFDRTGYRYIIPSVYRKD